MVNDSLTFISESNYLAHYGVLGMKWGVRRERKRLERENKRDLKWAKTKGAKITSKVQKSVSKDMARFEKNELAGQSVLNKSGKLSKTYVNQYNKKLAELMNEKVSDIKSPSGKVLRYIAKRGEVGVFTALADQGYNMDLVRNGVNATGRVAYRQDILTKS